MSTTGDAPKDTTPRAGRAVPEDFLTIQGQMRFVERFLPVRDKVFHDFYATPRDGLTVRRRKLQELRCAIQLVTAGKDKNAVEFYRLYNHLISAIWLAPNWGQYTDEIQKVTDPYQRICLATTNSVDICWRPVVENAPDDALLVEVGTGFSNGWARIALLMPNARFVSITLDPDQVEIGRRIADELGVAERVEFRLGDIFDPATTRDLIDVADAVTAMGVTEHFPPPRKAEGLRRMAAMLKPGAPLNVFNPYMAQPHPRWLTRILNSIYSWYHPTREALVADLDSAGVSVTRLDEHTPEDFLLFVADIGPTEQLRQEFDPITVWLWPRVIRFLLKEFLSPEVQFYLTAIRA